MFAGLRTEERKSVSRSRFVSKENRIWAQIVGRGAR